MNMKIFFTLFCFASLFAHADPMAYLSAFDSKVYSLKSKGLKDFVVDIESPRLRKQLNEQGTFGKVDDLLFRVYWTSSPERLAIEVLGMPEGFREVKEELRAGLLTVIEDLLPLNLQDKFKGYKFVAGSGPKEFEARDQTGIAPVPVYVLKFDSNDVLKEVVGKKHIGSLRITNDWVKEGFTDGKWALKEQVTHAEEGGNTVITTKELEYGTSQGIGVLEEVTFEVVQKSERPDTKTVKTEEKLFFKNYKLNAGEALKFFLGDAGKK